MILFYHCFLINTQTKINSQKYTRQVLETQSVWHGSANVQHNLRLHAYLSVTVHGLEIRYYLATCCLMSKMQGLQGSDTS